MLTPLLTAVRTQFRWPKFLELNIRVALYPIPVQNATHYITPTTQHSWGRHHIHLRKIAKHLVASTEGSSERRQMSCREMRRSKDAAENSVYAPFFWLLRPDWHLASQETSLRESHACIWGEYLSIVPSTG
mmetsp:Transcript_6181/g.12382  ORF Transcript_6181/g.12382 Transcript_6181/m.12382 type:complete len:131 (+) Transcript_6181:51-443(+)